MLTVHTVATHRVNLVGKLRVSPLRPLCVLAKGMATLVSAPASIRTKKECLVESESTETLVSMMKANTVVENQLKLLSAGVST